MKLFMSVAIAALFLSACALIPPSGVSDRDGVLTFNGMTLYTYDKDALGSGKSVCNGPCATNWPPLQATTTDSPTMNWIIITRDDGTRQWVYKGKPIYRWVKDTKPGDRTGDRFNEVWSIARPAWLPPVSAQR